MHKKSGFTFVELIVVVAIILILSVIIIPKLTGKTTEAKNKAAEGMLVSIASSLSMVKMDNPSAVYCRLQDLDNSSSPAEDAKGDSFALSSWNGPYIVYNRTSGGDADVPDDPWGNDYELDVSTFDDHGYAIIKSYGKDGVSGSSDDIEHKFF